MKGQTDRKTDKEMKVEAERLADWQMMKHTEVYTNEQPNRWTDRRRVGCKYKWTDGLSNFMRQNDITPH
jgi:hypothetical protein